LHDTMRGVVTQNSHHISKAEGPLGLPNCVTATEIHIKEIVK